jgi:hypothetical protein
MPGTRPGKTIRLELDHLNASEHQHGFLGLQIARCTIGRHVRGRGAVIIAATRAPQGSGFR